ncbi:uncharacterized protein LOC120324761 [Pipra filicauda]|uniref:Uncharacterized protein LOC113988734 n=1 Tax=Pipra filicauda TaxID=649802 RepID=A0A6J2GSI5_9PASS|nr:uncharacterized protein LOC113988734 [Pipra filicauda]XP_039244785.1 uncharacterized protein LOC120324761 [Pipra filicauda]
MDTAQTSKDPPRSFPPSSTSSRSSTNGFSTNYRKRSSISITFGIILLFACSITPATQTDLMSGALATPPPTIPNWVMLSGQNVWLNLAQSLNTDSLCLSTLDPSHPFKICLVGIPWTPREWGDFRNQYIPWCDDHGQFRNPFLDCLTRPAKTSHDRQTFSYQWQRPEQLEILGSIISPLCFYFIHNKYVAPPEIITVTSYGPYSNFSFWCKEEVPYQIHATPDSVILPKGVFLICGLRVWNMIPRLAAADPCTFGKLALYNPATRMKSLPVSPPKNQAKRNINLQTTSPFSHHRVRRQFQGLHPPLNFYPSQPKPPSPPKAAQVAVAAAPPPPVEEHPLEKLQSLSEFTAECNSNMHFWSDTANILSGILPIVSSTKALTLRTRMGCWLAKEANATSAALDDLLQDTQTNKKALLQNRAAIDFLLLVNGHGCQEFEGLCCLNFSDHSQSIHSQINQLKSLVHEIKEVDHLTFDDFFDWLPFKGLSSTIKKIIVVLVLGLSVVFLFMCVFPCLLSCARTSQSLKAYPTLEDKGGGDVAMDLPYAGWKKSCRRQISEDKEENSSNVVETEGFNVV